MYRISPKACGEDVEFLLPRAASTNSWTVSMMLTSLTLAASHLSAAVNPYYATSSLSDFIGTSRAL
jgi:hypothetical protein